MAAAASCDHAWQPAGAAIEFGSCSQSSPAGTFLAVMGLQGG